MAQYKVPQDVEADDKLLGPFTFRQFIYLLIVAALCFVAWLLFQVYPFLVIIPIPGIILFAALALPLKKDQPMETYLAALVSYYIKPHTRLWTPGQRESTILITAPKIVETPRARELSGEEASHRLSFLAEIIDSEGRAIKANSSPMKEELVAEANALPDMFEDHHFDSLNATLTKNATDTHAKVVNEMREAIANNHNLSIAGATIGKHFDEPQPPTPPTTPVITPINPITPSSPPVSSPTVTPAPSPTIYNSNTVIQPDPTLIKPSKPQNPPHNLPNPSIIELANNPDFSIATISKEAHRIKHKQGEDEVYISLH